MNHRVNINRARRILWAACALVLAFGSVESTARAEVTIVEADDWTFYSDGRVNGFLSHGFGDGFPRPIPPPLSDPADPSSAPLRSDYSIIQGWSGWRSDPPQEDADGNYSATRVRSGFVGSIFGFGLRRPISETTTISGYIGIWTSIATAKRKSLPDSNAPLTTTDARQGYLEMNGPWGSLTAGRHQTLFGRISTYTNFMYGHGAGLGLPCMDNAGNPGCGHIGTGVIGASFGSGFMYASPELAGFNLSVGLYDPVRILGGWVAADYPRPEAQLSWNAKFSETARLKIATEGLFQKLRYPEAPGLSAEDAENPEDVTTNVWGVTGGFQAEVDPFRLGISGFHGKGLGFYSALQNDPVMFSTVTGELRTFTGFYGQTAVVFGPWQVAIGGGRANVDQLAIDKDNVRAALPESQTGISAAVAYQLSDNLTLDVEFFRFMVKWFAVPNSHTELRPDLNDPTIMVPTDVIDEGTLPQHTQDVNFINAGATFQW